MVIPVTVTDKQAKALYVQFGADVDLSATTQRILDEALTQYERNLDDRERHEYKVAIDNASPAVQAEVKALLGLDKR